MSDAAEADGAGVQFFFDPTCPWTWNTACWLREVTEAEGVEVEWRSLSLAVVNAGKEQTDRHRTGGEAGRAALRIVEALRAQDRNDDIADLYTELGRRFHHDKVDRTVEEVRTAVDAAGLGDMAGAADDPSWDDALRASVTEAQAMAGRDTGSPVLAVGHPRRGFFGPIVSTPPTGEEAMRLWDVVRNLAAVPAFSELKTGRSGPPKPGPRP